MGLFTRRRRVTIGNPNGGGNANAMTASGFRVSRMDADVMRRLIQPWQGRSFAYYDTLGEIKYASQFYSRMLSPLKLYAGEIDEHGDVVETKDKDAIAALERIQDPGGGRTGLLASYGRLMFLTGECYLFVSTDPETGIEQWEMLSTDELRVISGGIYMRYKAPSLIVEEYREPGLPADQAGAWVTENAPFGEMPKGEWETVDPDREAVAYRLWQRHPRWSMLADSTMQGVLDLCEELLLLTNVVRARARSRLAGTGLLLIDSRISPPPLEPEPDEDPNVDPFMRALINAMTSPIVNEGAASQVVPLTLRVDAPENGTVADLIHHLQIVDPQQLYPETGLRYELIKRIAIGLDMPPEILLGMEDSNHWCVDDETEILTADGWKRHDRLAVGDEALTLNHETGLSEWKPVDDVARFDVVDLPMLSIESRFHSSLTTMNHRWPVLRLAGREGRWERDWTYSDELRTTHRLVTAAPSRDALASQWVQHDDALVELVAWLWTEGQVRERPGRRAPQVVIYQSRAANPENVLRIRAALTSLYGAAVAVPMRGGRGSAVEMQPRWREVVHGDMTRFVLNAAAADRLLVHVGVDRVVSTDFIRALTVSQLALFIDVSTRADGSTMRSGCQIVGQSDRARLAPLELATILLGRSPSSYSQPHDGFARHEQHYLSISDRQTVRLKKSHMSERRYTGTIWCPVTANATWCARRNGRVFFTGNTAWQIDEQTWKGHGQPKAQQLCDDLTSSYYRPYLRTVLKKPDWAKYVIAYDATDIINHPDRTKDAKDLFDRVALSHKALREATGFTEDDAPSEDERAERIGILVRDGSLAWFGTPAPRGGAVETAPGEITSNAPAAPGEPAADGTKPPGPATGAEVEKSPPKNSNQAPDEAVVGALVARIMGAADLGLLRAREAAGNRLLSLAKRDPELKALLVGVPTGQVAAKLGRVRVRALKAPPDRDLVKDSAALIRDACRVWMLKPDIGQVVAEHVERHAAATLYDETPGSLPATFANYVAGLLVK